MFYSIPCLRKMIAARQTDFIGKMMRGPPDRPSRNMMTACCDHKQRVGRPQTTGKNVMVENLRLLFRDVNTVHIDCFGSLRDWINKASSEDYWNQLVKRLLHPNTPLPERPETWGPLPSWRAQRAANRQRPTHHDVDDDKDDENSSNVGSNKGDGNRENHRDKGSHGRGQRQPPPPCCRELPPCMSNNPGSICLPLLNTIQNGGSTMRIFAYKLDAACSNHSRFSVLDSEHPKPKSKSTIANLPANIILTRMILQSLVSPHLKLLPSSNF